jgi:hypothetical protein
VALEQSRDTPAPMLNKYERLHLFPVPSTMAGNMPEVLHPSGAKDDPRDADLLLDLLLKHRDELRRLSPDTNATRRVQNLLCLSTATGINQPPQAFPAATTEPAPALPTHSATTRSHQGPHGRDHANSTRRRIREDPIIECRKNNLRLSYMVWADRSNRKVASPAEANSP